ncbi:MAG: TonB-dependent receptor [Acidobacteriota bacterium]|nr:TonB-dependent receptor [Acidobacteriota bacterium]
MKANKSLPAAQYRAKDVGLSALVAIVCLLSLGSLACSAQTSKGILTGVVRDSTGAVVQNADVVITNEATNEARTVTTSSTGAYRAEAINPGPYRIHIASAGFTAVDVQNVNVQPSVVTTYDATLSIGKAQETLTVEAGGNTINTENGQLSGAIDTAELQKIPIFTLNPAELTSTLPGVTRELVTVQNLGGVGGNGLIKLTVNGARPRTNNFMIDSQDANDISIGGEAFQPILPDLFQSVTVLLNDASAEYGRGGGAVINQITKSGTNQFHGSVHEIYTGSGLDAIDGQTRRSEPAAGRAAKSRYDQHQYGFTLGGPVLRNKLFAFGGATFVRYYGNFQYPNTELPDASGFAQLKAIAAAGNTQATALMGYLNNGSYLTSGYSLLQSGTENLGVSPRPGCPGGCSISTSTFSRLPVPAQQPETQWTYKVDYTPRASDTFSIHYLHDRGLTAPYYPLNPSTLPGFDTTAGGPTELGGGNWVHIFTPNLLNEFRASEVRLSSQFAPDATALKNPVAQVYQIRFSGTSIGDSLGTLGISQNMPQGRIERLYQFQDTVSWTHGRQSLRMGGDIGRLLETDLVAQTFLGLETFTAGAGLSSMDNYLSNSLGTSGTATKSFGPTRVDPHIWKMAGFVQDDVKLLSNLTVNLGVRYDYLSNPLNALAYPGLDLNNTFAPINTVVHVQDDKNNIAPRIGFAYVPREGIFSDGKTVFHGGIGIFYDSFFTNILVNAAQSSPVAPTTTLQQGVSGCCGPASTLIATITPIFSANSSVQSDVSNLVNPITYQYNFGLERQLPFRMKGTLNYVGSRGEKLYSNRQLNYVVNGARINPARGVINVRDNRADSQYHALQAELDRQFSQGLFFRVSYTYGKLLDDSSEVFTTFASPTSYSANLAGNGLHQDWGPSAYDRRHLLVFTYAYTPKGFHSENAVADKVFSAFTRNFTISGQTELYSGLYTSFNVSGKDINGDSSITNDRPVLSNTAAPIAAVGVDGSYIGGTAGTYYDYAAYNASLALAARVRTPVSPGAVHFLVPSPANGALLLQQEVGRNSYLNPGQQYWNLALEKAIPTPFAHLEHAQFIFRVEAQQLGNHNNLTFYSNNVTQVGLLAFQNPSGAREPNNQKLRFWAKYEF